LICHLRAIVRVIGKTRKNQIQEIKNNRKMEVDGAIRVLQAVQAVQVNKKAKDLSKDEATHVKTEQNHIVAITKEGKKKQLHQQPDYSSQTLTLKYLLTHLVFN